jgi:hypothetical protein
MKKKFLYFNFIFSEHKSYKYLIKFIFNKLLNNEKNKLKDLQ